MEVETNEEFEDIEVKSSDSLVVDSNSYQQGSLGDFNEPSLEGPEERHKLDNKHKHIYNAGETEDKTNISVIKINNTMHKIKKTPPSKTDTSYKEGLQEQFVNIQSKKKHSNVSIKSPDMISRSLQDSDEESNIEQYKIFPKSTPSCINVNSNLIVVKFEFENISFASAFDLTMTIEEIKKWLIYNLELEEDLVILEMNDIEVKNFHSLADLGGQPHSKVVIKISSKGEVGKTLIREKIKENIPTIDVITVHLDEIESQKDIVVEIHCDIVQKLWLGGYRNKLTGTEYHNAYTQTMKEKKFFKFDEASGEKIPLFFNRDSQTPFPLLEKTVDTTINKATQMSRSDLYLTSKKDKIMTAQKFNSVEKAINEYCVKNIIIIQRAVRRWIALNKFKYLIDGYLEEVHIFKEGRQQIIQEQIDRERIVITGAAHPVKRDDFYTLFLKIEKWWEKEWKKICKTKSLESKKAACALLIKKETDLLEAIEKHKVVGKKESLKKEDIRFLERTSKPEVFRSSKGQLTIIDYLATQKARAFKEIYSALTRKDLLIKNRLEILITLKNMFETNYMSYEYAQDLVSLINREIQLIEIGMRLKDLKGLQSRIEQLFLDFLHQPEFNPSVKKYKKPNAPKTLLQTFQCSGCLKLLPVSKYNVHVRMTAYTHCRSCTWMENIAHQRADLTSYLKLLLNVRNSEMEKCSYSALCFILQPIGMSYLTNIIWHGRSVISECSDISKLQHIRWLSDVEWAPWNTILLTNQEAKLHNNIPNVFTFYDTKFIEKIRQKHMLARKRFISLLKMEHGIRISGDWYKVTDSGVFLDPSHSERIATESNEFDTI